MFIEDCDLYIPINCEGFPTGVLLIEKGFDILKLKDMTFTDAILYLTKNNVKFLSRGGVKGTLKFKEK